MSNKMAHKLFLLALVVFIIWVVFVATAPAYADDDCRGNSCNGGGDVDVDVGGDTINVGGDTITGGDVSVPVDITGGSTNTNVQHESRSIGLVNSLGDVDIAGCLGSTQWATPIYSRQKLVVNWPCLAEFYLNNGKYELAAMAICNTEVVKEFESEEACEAAHDFVPVASAPAPAPSKNYDREVEVFRDQVAMLQMEIQQIEDRIEMAESAEPVPPQIINRPAFTEEQKLAAWAALKGEGEDEDE